LLIDVWSSLAAILLILRLLQPIRDRAQSAHQAPITNLRTVLHRLVALILEQLAINLRGIRLTVHKCDESFLIVQGKFLVEFDQVALFGNDITDTPSVYLPGLHAFVSMLLEHVRIGCEFWHYLDIADTNIEEREHQDHLLQ